MIGDLGEVCVKDPSPWVLIRGAIFSCCLGESSITMGTLVGVWGFNYLILVLFLVLKYNGVCLCLLPFCLIGMLRIVREATASLSVGSGDTLGDPPCLLPPLFHSHFHLCLSPLLQLVHQFPPWNLPLFLHHFPSLSLPLLPHLFPLHPSLDTHLFQFPLHPFNW